MLGVFANVVAGWPVLHHHVELAGALRPGHAHPQLRARVPHQLGEVPALRVPGLPKKSKNIIINCCQTQGLICGTKMAPVYFDQFLPYA